MSESDLQEKSESQVGKMSSTNPRKKQNRFHPFSVERILQNEKSSNKISEDISLNLLTQNNGKIY
jgi:hypothetical protein